jgi:hypothetical protein
MCSRLYCDEVAAQEPHSQITSNKNTFIFSRIGTFFFGVKHIIFSNLWKTVNCLREKVID